MRRSYGDLVGTAFVVMACFHLLLALLGVVAALAAPAWFNLNGAPADGPAQALGALAMMIVVFLLLDAAAAAIGAAVWMAVRRLVPARSSA